MTDTLLQQWQDVNPDATVVPISDTYNGWANYETWNASLWIQNDEFLYNTAKACVIYREGLETPWDKFVRCMMEGQIGSFLGKTGDGVAWNDPAIDADEMNEMLWELGDDE
jgi:hypothetical protein